MTELLLLRHAHAGDSTTWQGDDDLRPLTEKGRRQSERVGRLLAAAGYAPDAVLASPLVRARETAEIVADVLGRPRRAGHAPGRAARPRDRRANPRRCRRPRRPVLVGHDPDFSELVSELVGAPIPMRKGTLARIDVERPLAPGAGDLRWLVPPDLLRS